jgi:hypothetical protein
MAGEITIDEYSCSTLLIEMRFGEHPLSIGTAFTFLVANQVFLITNWHNVSGRDPRTMQCLSPTAAQPDHLAAFLHVDGRLGSRRPQFFELFDEARQPIWFEHPVHGPNVDVVALPITYDPGLTSYPINTLPSAPYLNVRIGQDVFVIGYPFGLSLAQGFPVWKRASIATEPAFDVEKLPKFMIDTASRPGMSGSPVVRGQYGQYQGEDGSFFVTTGAATKFLGIYSGRIGADDELKAQLGTVWKAPVIEEIISERVQGSR